VKLAVCKEHNSDVLISEVQPLSENLAVEDRDQQVSACVDLGKVTTRRNLQVDREFQKASATLCKRRWRTFRAFTVTLPGCSACLHTGNEPCN